MTSLLDHLRNVGIKKGNEISAPEVKPRLPLEKVLSARSIENQFGKVVIKENTYPYGYQHGNALIVQEVQTNTIHRAGKLSDPEKNLKNMLFLDTETTGLSGGTGTLAFLIGVARFSEEGLILTQFIVEDPYDEPAMLLEFSNFCSNIEAVITFNGKSYDMPLLKTRYLLNKFPVPFQDWAHLDLLHLSRKIWRPRMESCSLKDLEKEILNLPRSEDEVPGWMIPEIYFNFLRTGDASQISNVIYHNAMDIVSLVALYLTIVNMLDKDLFTNQMNRSDVFTIGQLYERIGEIDRAIKIYQYCRNNTQNNIEINKRMANLYKKSQCYKDAIPLWNENAEKGDFEACIELAKYFEHEERQSFVALDWTQKAIIMLEEMKISSYKKKELKKALVIRENRLEKRICDVSEKNA